MLSTRIFSACVFVPLLLFCVWKGGFFLTAGCVFLAQMMLWECLRLLKVSAPFGVRVLFHLVGLAVSLCLMGKGSFVDAGLVVPCAVMGVLVWKLFTPEPLNTSITQVACVLFALGYSCGLIPYWSLLRELPDNKGQACALMALLCTWASDTGAYFTGRAWGGKKLYPVISPGKTWAGVWGGLVASVLAAYGVMALLHPATGVLDVCVLGVLAAVCGTLGDLCESMLKRSVGAKDSSQCIPGHGGFLDRFDALLFVVPAFYLFLR